MKITEDKQNDPAILAERYKMALEAILELCSYHNISVSQNIAKTALKGERK